MSTRMSNRNIEAIENVLSARFGGDVRCRWGIVWGQRELVLRVAWRSGAVGADVDMAPVDVEHVPPWVAVEAAAVALAAAIEVAR